MGGFRGAMFMQFSAVKCSIIYPTMKSNHLRSHMTFALHGMAQTWLALNIGLHWRKCKNRLTTFTNVFLERFVDNVHSSVSPLWDTEEEICQVTENSVSLEKEFLLYRCRLLLLVVIPYLLWTWVASNPIWHQSLATTQSLPFGYWPTGDFNSLIKLLREWMGLSSVTMTNRTHGTIKIKERVYQMAEGVSLEIRPFGLHLLAWANYLASLRV